MTGLEALEVIAGDNSYCDEETFYYNKEIVEKSLKALEILKRFIWVEDDKLMCGRYGDIEIELDESDFEDDEELNLLKEVLE